MSSVDYRGSEDKAIIIMAAIIEKDRKLLMVQEGKEEAGGKWNVPAGHIIFGEDPLEAVKREVKEETGFEVEPTELGRVFAFNDSENVPVLRFNVYCKLTGETSEREPTILDISWYGKDELETMRDKGELRSKRTWMTIQDWIENKRFPLETINVRKEKL